MRILVTGAKGQLGLAIKSLSGNYNHQFVFTDVDELDIANRLVVDEYFSKLKPDIVINCAGYTNVEKAESEQELAYNINCKAVKNLSDISENYNVKLIHISTDFIFDGNRNVPYTEDDLPCPVNIYGSSKYEGEKKLINSKAVGIILRTSWLFSEYGHNFVKTIYNLAQEKTEIKVVNDQFGSPTYAKDLANMIMKVIESDKWKNGCEVYHFCNQGVVSWYDLALEIVRQGDYDCKIIPVMTEEYGSGVIRPKYSVLDTSKIRKEYGIEIKSWKEALIECIQKINISTTESTEDTER